MNVSLPQIQLRATEEDAARARQFRSLLSLLALYTTALVAVVVLPDGADIGCILGGIAGHMLYAGAKLALEWRDASSLAYARGRILRRRYA
jgi:hypothetical protein